MLIECLIVVGFECEIVVSGLDYFWVINLWVVKCGWVGIDGKLFVFVGYIDVVFIGFVE